MSRVPQALYMTWQHEESGAIVPIGRLQRTAAGYEFAYIRSAETAHKLGFEPLLTFPDLNSVYRTADLPPLLSNRLMRPTREDFAQFVERLGLGVEEAEPFTVLARSGGRRTTDRLEVFAPPQHCGDHFEGLLLARGVRHIEGAEMAIQELHPGDPLRLRAEPINAYNRNAQQILSESGQPLGYLPNYLADELARSGKSAQALALNVRRVNPPPGPVHHRLLCKYTCDVETGSSLFRDEMYEPISVDASPRAA